MHFKIINHVRMFGTLKKVTSTGCGNGWFVEWLANNYVMWQVT